MLVGWTDFDLSLENAWYGRVSLLCSMKFRTDNGEVRDVDCAMMDVFFDYAEGRCFRFNHYILVTIIF